MSTPSPMPMPDPQLMQALMSRPHLMQLMMQLMQMSQGADQAAMQSAMESGDQNAMADALGIEHAQFAQLQSVLTRELTALSSEYPQLAEMAQQMASGFGAGGPPTA